VLTCRRSPRITNVQRNSLPQGISLGNLEKVGAHAEEENPGRVLTAHRRTSALPNSLSQGISEGILENV
jgi:hypothetical protein